MNAIAGLGGLTILSSKKWWATTLSAPGLLNYGDLLKHLMPQGESECPLCRRYSRPQNTTYRRAASARDYSLEGNKHAGNSFKLRLACEELIEFLDIVNRQLKEIETRIKEMLQIISREKTENAGQGNQAMSKSSCPCRESALSLPPRCLRG